MTVVTQLKEGIGEKEYAFSLEYVKCGGNEIIAYAIAFKDEVTNNIDLNTKEEIEEYCKLGGEQLVNNPRVKKAIQVIVLEAFAEDAVSARHVLVEVMEDKLTPPAVRRLCATDILNIAKIDPGKTIRIKGMRTDESTGFNLSKLSKTEQDTMEAMLIKMHEEPDDGEWFKSSYNSCSKI